jgi:hypothetical protein
VAASLERTAPTRGPGCQIAPAAAPFADDDERGVRQLERESGQDFPAETDADAYVRAAGVSNVNVVQALHEVRGFDGRNAGRGVHGLRVGDGPEVEDRERNLERLRETAGDEDGGQRFLDRREQHVDRGRLKTRREIAIGLDWGRSGRRMKLKEFCHDFLRRPHGRTRGLRKS